MQNETHQQAIVNNQERLLISQKQIKAVQRQLLVQQEKMDVEVLSNQQTILRQQEEVQAVLHQIKVQQKQMKSNQDRLDQFFATLEAVLNNQDRIQANQQTIINNQMKIMQKIESLSR